MAGWLAGWLGGWLAGWLGGWVGGWVGGSRTRELQLRIPKEEQDEGAAIKDTKAGGQEEARMREQEARMREP
jgi:hypothetical protein